MAKYRSPVWEWFTYLKMIPAPGKRWNDKLSQCGICGLQINQCKGSPMPLESHLKKFHPKEYEKYLLAKYPNRIIGGGLEPESGRAEEIRPTEALGLEPTSELEHNPNLTITDQIVGAPNLQQPEFDPDEVLLMEVSDIPSTSTDNSSEERMKTLYANIKKIVSDSLEKDLENFENLGLSCDIWSTPSSHNYLVLFLHYIDAKFGRNLVLLDVVPLSIDIDASALTDAVDKILEQFPIVSKMTRRCFVTSDASNRILNQALINSKYIQKSIPCITSRLANALSTSISTFSKLHNAVQKCLEIQKILISSQSEKKQMEKLCKKFQVPFEVVSVDAEVLPVNIHQIVSSVVSMQKPLQSLKSGSFLQVMPTTLQFEIMRQIHPFLKIVSDTIKIFLKEACLSESLLSYLNEIEECIVACRRSILALPRSNPDVANLMNNFLDEIRQEIDDSSPQLAALILNPRSKGMPVLDSLDLDSKYVDILLKCSPAKADHSGMNPSEKIAFKKSKSYSSDLMSELDQYLAEELSNDCSALDWWKSKESKLPLLAKLAREMLSIPCSAPLIQTPLSVDFGNLKILWETSFSASVPNAHQIYYIRAHRDLFWFFSTEEPRESMAMKASQQPLADVNPNISEEDEPTIALEPSMGSSSMVLQKPNLTSLKPWKKMDKKVSIQSTRLEKGGRIEKVKVSRYPKGKAKSVSKLKSIANKLSGKETDQINE